MGPLNGIRVIEFTGIGPAPMAGMLLADLGASVIRLDRPAAAEAMNAGAGGPHMSEGRTVLPADLKSDEGRAFARDLVSRADVLLEGFRPGVMERLGLGPEPVSNSTRAWSTRVSPAGARKARWPAPPGTT